MIDLFVLILEKKVNLFWNPALRLLLTLVMLMVLLLDSSRS